MKSEDEFLKRWLKWEEDNKGSKKDDFFDNIDQFRKMNAALKMSSRFAVPSTKSKEQAWAEIATKLDTHQVVKENTKIIPLYKKKTFSLMAVAASIALLIGIYFVFLHKNDTVFKTGNAQTLAIKLPDNSTITLNADSKISFNNNGWIENRVIFLTGEAFFEIEKGNSFSVICNGRVVEVLGTSFNINSRDDHYEVACFTGEVAVKVGAQTVTLTKGKATNLQNTALEKPYGFSKKKVKGWKIGKFYFEEVALQDVFKEFERQFDVTLEYDTDIALRTYTGYFANKNINEALQLICDPMRLSYKNPGNGLITIK